MAGRVTAVITIVALGKTLRMAVPEANRRSTGTDVTAAIAGVLAGLALAAYLVATRTELVAIAVVLSPLYPVVPVLLGITVLREKLNWRQCAGLTGALAATVLIATA